MKNLILSSLYVDFVLTWGKCPLEKVGTFNKSLLLWNIFIFCIIIFWCILKSPSLPSGEKHLNRTIIPVLH